MVHGIHVYLEVTSYNFQLNSRDCSSLKANIAATEQVAQSVTCLTANPGVQRSIPAWFHTFMEIDHEIISMVILLPSADSRRVVVSYKRKYVHKVLVNHLVKLAQGKSGFG